MGRSLNDMHWPCVKQVAAGRTGGIIRCVYISDVDCT